MQGISAAFPARSANAGLNVLKSFRYVYFGVTVSTRVHACMLVRAN